MTRGAAVAAVSLAVLLVATMATPALAAVAPPGDTSPQTNGSEVSSAGPFDIDQLRNGGTQPSAAPPSVRYVGDTEIDGAIAVRYRPADPLSNDPIYLEGGQTLNTDQIELYSTVFGDSTGEYELVIVYWQPESRQTENGTAVDVAANQEVQRATVTVEDGYANAPVELNSHYDSNVQATMWLEQDGQAVDGARWRFEHASAPASQQVTIETQADAWWYSFRTAILPGVASIIIGLSGAKATLRLAGRGPGYSLTSWGIASAILVTGVLGGLYYEVATVVANLDVLMGLSLLPIAYGGGLRMSPPTERIAFVRKELTDAVSLRRGETDKEPDALADGGEAAGGVTDSVELGEDGYFDELYEQLAIKTTIRAPDGGRMVPKKGIRPFFARLFAKAARLDLSQLRTRVRVEGDATQKVYVDPDEDNAVRHRPAHLRRRMPVWHRLPEPADGESLSPITRGLYGLLTVATLGLPVIGWYAGEAAANIPTVGAFAGLVLLAVESYEAVDGAIDFEPAPRHDLTADASLTVMQSEHADAKLLEDYEEIAWSERIKTALEARDIDSRRDRSMIQTFLEDEIGVSLEALGLDDNAGTDVEAEDTEFDFNEIDPQQPEEPAARRAEGDDD
ncbi:hypothetical protein [Halorubrum sp. CBA1229]|uniref:hypothetical protein n=1 Tax=Halorubrum sp. CBA1229 TaxID=1853699 RepID=UPI000F40BE75|nr:hypothetical protein [Halorubrum sp. CBA1229]QKY18298.1 hypothetical protein Hrr1229_015930 [Halorubrum sp. CBA1229]